MNVLHSIFQHPVAGKAVLVALLATLLAVNRFTLLEARVERAESLVMASGEVLYVPDVRTTRITGLGYDQAMADLMWVRTLGYFASHFNTDREYRWLEHFIEQIVALDPKFRAVYHWAGANVLYGRRFTNATVLNSNRFYQMAMDRFPDDFEAPYRIGINYYIEMRGADEAETQRFREIGLSYMEAAANRPDAPPRLRSLVAAISNRLGKQQVALQYLVDLYLQTDDPKTKAGLKARMDAMRDAQDNSALLEEAQSFDAHRTALVPYVPPGVFALMQEPESTEQKDVDWRALLPDVNLSVNEPAPLQEIP